MPTSSRLILRLSRLKFALLAVSSVGCGCRRGQWAVIICLSSVLVKPQPLGGFSFFQWLCSYLCTQHLLFHTLLQLALLLQQQQCSPLRQPEHLLDRLTNPPAAAPAVSTPTLVTAVSRSFVCPVAFGSNLSAMPDAMNADAIRRSRRVYLLPRRQFLKPQLLNCIHLRRLTLSLPITGVIRTFSDNCTQYAP